jgi:hypothetical protein
MEKTNHLLKTYTHRCEKQSDEAIDAFVIASLNAFGVQAWQSRIWEG